LERNPLGTGAATAVILGVRSLPAVASLAGTPHPPTFKFESHWACMPGFTECVQQAWAKPVAATQNAMMTLHIKLARTSKALQAWAHSLMPQGKLAAAIYREVIAQLEAAQELRHLSEEENSLKKLLKHRILGLAAMER
jgi:hypothetical protein